MIRSTIRSALNENFAMILIFTVAIVTIRLMYLLVHKEKFILYKEIFMLSFLLYSLLLFYVVTFQDVNYGTDNFVPFKEILRYKFGTKLFIKNIIGNIILFIPFGTFVSVILRTRKIYPIFIISVITSSVVEYTQLKIGRTFDIDDIFLNIIGGIFGYILYLLIDTFEHHLPKFVNTLWFKNLFSILFILLLVFVYTNFSFWGILK